MATKVQLLDSNLNLLGEVKAFYHLNGNGDILHYSKELSDFGTCTFRMSAYDSQFTSLGDVVVPHKNHIRVVRNGTTVWQGAVIENPTRTKDYVEVVAVEYLWYLGKKLVSRTSNNPNTGAADGLYRIFNSGTMAAAVTAILTETIASYASGSHALASLTVGTVENPNYPPNMTDGNGNPLSGAWSFGDGTTAPQLTFDFHSVLYILQQFGVYSYADFRIDNGMVFSFKKFLGNDHHYDVNFRYGEQGNAIDFNISRLGQRQVNDLWGIAVDNNNKILHAEQTDQTSIKTNGILEEVMSFNDIKDQGTLNARIVAQLPLVSTADSSANTIVLSEKAYPLGVYDIGDIVTVKVETIAVSHEEISRVVGISVALNDTGRELTTIQTNKPLPWQYGAS